MCFRTSRNNDIAKYASPKLQELLAENAPAFTHRAENGGDLITADHKVLNEVCESRNSHR